jgi:hypothetical protein
MASSSGKSLLYGLVGLASLLGVGVAYAAGHKPFSAENLVGLTSAIWQVIVSAFLIAVAGGVGERLLPRAGGTGPARAGLALALGLIPVSAGILLLGSLTGTGLAVLAVPAVALIVLLRAEIWRWVTHLVHAGEFAQGKYEPSLALLTALIFLIHLVLALTPPVDFDSLVYHFALPQGFLDAGRIVYLPDSMFWGMPQLTETIFIPAMRFGGVQAAAAMGVFLAAVAVCAIVDYARARFGGVAAWTAVAALLAGESLSRALSSGYVEWTALLYGWAALAALDDWLGSEDRRQLILTGIFCGGALGTKYTAGVLLLGCMVVLLGQSRSMGWRRTVSAVLLVGACALAASLHWWVRNLLGTGNPFYPFFFPAGAMDSIRLEFYQHVAVWGDWRSVVLIPWQATIWGIEGRQGFAASIGPLLAALSPLAWMNWRARPEDQRRTLGIAAAITITGLLVWAAGSRLSGLLIQSRLFFVVFPAWAMLAGCGMQALWDLKAGGIRFGRLAGALVIFFLGLNLSSTALDFVQRDPLAYILRFQDQSEYLQNRMGPYAAAMQAIESLPPGSRVLMLWEARGFYCQPRCNSDEVIDRWFHDSRTYGDENAIMRAWQMEGYTHMLLFNLGADFVRDDDPAGARMDWALLDRTLARLAVEQSIDGGVYTLYRIPQVSQ